MPEGWETLLTRLLQADRSDWLYLIRSDQHARWHQGRRVPAEAYLGHLAPLKLSDEIAVDLIYSEVLLRHELGETPAREEYIFRFPRHAEELARQFELRQAVQGCAPVLAPSANGPDSRRSSDTLRLDSSTGEHRVLQVEPDWPMPPPGYVLLREIGRGGMGVVFLARQLIVEREVALKMIRRDERGDEGARRRFHEEAAAAARLNHPNIVQVYEVGEWPTEPGAPPSPFISFEYCSGGNLAARTAGEPVPPRQAAELIETLARAVHHAHQQGVIHRDLKPANILLANATPKIADFGLARRRGYPDGSGIYGTPAYMAPEQTRGEEAGPAADVHGLGTILYELLAGRQAFGGGSLIETLAAVRRREPEPPSHYRRKVHPDLDTICLKCLQKDPARRYASALELAEELRRYLDGEPILARPLGTLARAWRWSRRHPARAGLVLVSLLATLALLGGLVWHRIAVAEAHARAERAQEAEKAQRYVFLTEEVRSPQGRGTIGWTRLALASLREAAAVDTPLRDQVELRSEAAAVLASVDLGPGEVISSGFYAGAIATSPDARYLAVGEQKAFGWVSATVRVLPCQGEGRPRSFSVKADAFWSGRHGVQDGIRSLAFSRDGRQLFAGTRSGWLCRWELTSSSDEPVCWHTGDTTIDILFATGDGRAVIASSRHGRRIERWDVTQSPPRLAATCTVPQGLLDAAYDPAADVLACCRDDGIALVGGAGLVPLPVRVQTPGSRLRFSPDGRTLLVFHEGQFVVVDSRGRVARRFRESDEPLPADSPPSDMAFSPEADVVVTAWDNDEDRTIRLWETSSGRLLTRFVVPGRGPILPTFLPGSRALVMACQRELKRFPLLGHDLARITAVQTYPVRAFAVHGANLATIAEEPVEPDGRQRGQAILWRDGLRRAMLPFETVRDSITSPRAAFIAGGKQLLFSPTAPRLHMWDLEGTGEQSVTVASMRDFVVGPDGKRVWTLAGGSMQSWDLPSFRPATAWEKISTEGLATLYSLAAGRERVLAGGRDGRVHLLRAVDGQPERSWAGPGGPVSAAALLADESLGAVGTRDGRLHVHDLSGDGKLLDASAHDDAVEALAFAPSGLLASGSRDRSVKLWRRDGNRYELLLSLRGFPRAVRDLRFDEEGRRLFILLEYGAGVRVWDLERLRAECEALGIAW